MKKITTTLFIWCAFLLLSTSTLHAQQTYITNEVRQYMSKGEQNGIEIILKGSNVATAKYGLKKLSKKYDAKVVSEKKSPEILLDNALIPTVSANTVDIYAMVIPVDNGAKVTFFTDLGGAFVSSAVYGSQYAAMEAVMKEFAQSQALVSVGEQLKTEQSSLKSLQKELKSLQKEKEKKLKELEKAKNLITTLEQDITKNDTNQAAKQQQISLQEQIIDTVKTKKSSLKN